MLSIIIPAHSDESTIKRTLDALQGALHPGVVLELIVVADNATDHTVHTIQKSYGAVKLLQSKGNGRAAAMNTGLEAATGKYVVYLDDDAIAGENYFTGKIEHLEKNADCDACYGACDFYGPVAGKPAKEDNYPQYSDGTRYAREHLVNHLGGRYLPQSTIIWRRDFLLRRKGHNENIDVHHDVELFVRSIFNGLRITAVTGNSKMQLNRYCIAEPGVNEPEKWLQIVKLRKKMFADLKTFSFEEDDCFLALSTYLFHRWRLLRHTHPDLATEYLQFAKKVCWPVPVNGAVGYRLLSMLVGPERATEIKYPLKKNEQN